MGGMPKEPCRQNLVALAAYSGALDWSVAKKKPGRQAGCELVSRELSSRKRVYIRDPCLVS